ncbi:MAG: TetR/AcrR family transcriptional regulator [Eubacterium sp.]|nr:TetR/AcrR family transcriptional regulator [Eubacterium sp.]
MNTKEMILAEALSQFSEKGYAATSMSDIAKPLGITKAALYKHFESKQQIFDLIVEGTTERYDELLESLSLHLSADKPAKKDVDFYSNITPETLCDSVLKFVKFTMTDTYSVQVRHMLTMSQFQTPELGEMYTKRYVDTMLKYDEKIFKELMKRGIMKKSDAHQMALYFVAPVYMYMGIWDREPDRAKECMSAIRKHVKNFIELTKISNA